MKKKHFPEHNGGHDSPGGQVRASQVSVSKHTGAGGYLPDCRVNLLGLLLLQNPQWAPVWGRLASVGSEAPERSLQPLQDLGEKHLSSFFSNVQCN